jgi:hypothetical protein
MGHIVNPTIYRLGKMVPWVSSGFKRITNERSRIANEDFLIYNFTRNFFYKKVYKKVIGKLKKASLKVRKKKQVRKTKRKRKFGKTSLLNHWIIKYSHLTITRFNKNFQLNLFFFDRELQKKYRTRYRRSLMKLKKKRVIKKKRFVKKIQRLKRELKRKLQNKTIKFLKTKVYFNGSANDFNTSKVFTPKIEDLSLKISQDLRNFIKPKKKDKINYTVARDRRKKGEKRERIYVYKDNTFETNKIINRLAENNKEVINSSYKNLYFSKLLKKLYYKPWFQQYTNNYFKPQESFYLDSFFFTNYAQASNRYLYNKGVVSNKAFGLSAQTAYNKRKLYIENMRKNTNKVTTTTTQSLAKINIMEIGNKRFERKIDTIKMKFLARKLKKRAVIHHLKKIDIWKKHYLRMKLGFIYKKLTRKKRKVVKLKYRSAKNFAKRIRRIRLLKETK